MHQGHIEPMDSWTHLPQVWFEGQRRNGQIRKYLGRMKEISIAFVITVVLNIVIFTISNSVFAG